MVCVLRKFDRVSSYCLKFISLVVHIILLLIMCYAKDSYINRNMTPPGCLNWTLIIITYHTQLSRMDIKHV